MSDPFFSSPWIVVLLLLVLSIGTAFEQYQRIDTGQSPAGMNRIFCKFFQT